MSISPYYLFKVTGKFALVPWFGINASRTRNVIEEDHKTKGLLGYGYRRIDEDTNVDVTLDIGINFEFIGKGYVGVRYDNEYTAFGISGGLFF